MKAISLDPAFVTEMILKNEDIIRLRWQTTYRGDLLICSTSSIRLEHAVIPGHALCVARLKQIDCEELKYRNAPSKHLYHWNFDKIRIIRPIPVKGNIYLWDYKGLIEYMTPPRNQDDLLRLYKDIWEPIMVK